MNYVNVLLPKKHFYIIICFCSLIIFCECLDALISFRQLSNYVFVNPSVSTEHLQVLMVSYMMNFLMKVVPFMILGIHSYICFTKIPINNIFVLIWGLIIIGIFIINLREFNLYSIMYYLKVIGSFVLILTVFNLTKVIKSKKTV